MVYYRLFRCPILADGMMLSGIPEELAPVRELMGKGMGSEGIWIPAL